MDWITVLVRAIPEHGKSLSIRRLYFEKKAEMNMSEEEFRADFDKFLRKKVKSFVIDGEYGKSTMNGDVLCINKYVRAELPQLFRYFKLSDAIPADSKSKSVSLRLLYSCWKHEDTNSYEEFEMELSRYIANEYKSRNRPVIFNGKITVKRER